MKRLLILLLLAAVMPVVAAADRNPETMNERDHELNTAVADVCSGIGIGLCDRLKDYCSSSGSANYCFLATYVSLGIDAERCGAQKVFDCEATRKHYEQRVLAFAKDGAAAEPGMARLVLNACWSLYSIEPKHPQLKKVAQTLTQHVEGGAQYYDFEGMFNCIRERYLNAAIP